jgi:hypothetical protein
MKTMMFAMLVVCMAALAGCTTGSGIYSRPINPADGGQISAVETRVSAIEAKETGWNTGGTVATNALAIAQDSHTHSTNAQDRVGAVETLLGTTVTTNTFVDAESHTNVIIRTGTRVTGWTVDGI